MGISFDHIFPENKSFIILIEKMYVYVCIYLYIYTYNF